MAPPPITKDSLRKRMQDETRGIAPDLHPRARHKSEEAELEERPAIGELGLPSPVKLKLSKLIKDFDGLNQQKLALEKQTKVLNAEIKELVKEHLGSEKMAFDVGGIPVSMYPVPRTSIKAHLLLLNGVDQDIIDASTETTESMTLKIGRSADPAARD